MKKTIEHIIPLVCLLLLSYSANSQIVVSGTVVDNTNLPIEFANVVLLNTQSNVIANTITDEKGNFTIKADTTKNVTIKISFIGCSDYIKTINKTENLKTISLKSNTELGEVVVRGRKKIIEQKVDRLVFNVENSTNCIGGDLTDALKITPGLVLINNNISIFGKDGVKIMINGKITPIPSGGLNNFLTSIRTEDIKAIEVITNPPAEFDADGNYGLINIIYKKKINFWQTRFNSSYIQTTYPAFTTGVNFSYKKKKISLFVDINGKKGNEEVIEKSDIFYPTQIWYGSLVRKDKKDFLSGRLSLQYDLTKKFSFGVQYVGGFENPAIEDKNTVNIVKETNSLLDSVLISQGYNDRQNHNNSFNAYGILKLDTLGRKITFDVDYFNYIETQNRDFETQTFMKDNDLGNIFYLSQNSSKQDINNYSFKTDLVYPIGKFNLEFGGKLSFINNDNSVCFFDKTNNTLVLDTLQSDEFNYKEKTQSLYCSISHKLNEKWQLKVGIRFENTITRGFSKTLNKINNITYNKLFPTSYISYQPNKKNYFHLSYGRRIKRPKFWEINPFRWYIDEFSYSEGNPFLQPSFKDNLEFNHIYKNNLTSILFASLTTDGFGQIPIVDTSSRLVVLTRNNYFKRYNYGVGLVYRFNKFSWLSSFIHTQVYYSETEFDSNVDLSLKNQEQNGFNYSISNYNTFIFDKNKTFLGELNFWYSSGKERGLYYIEPAYSVSLGFKKLFFDNDLQIAMNIYDIFKTSNSDLITKYNNGVSRIANVYYDNRYFKISVSYRLGNKNIKSRKRKFGNKEEKRRI